MNSGKSRQNYYKLALPEVLETIEHAISALCVFTFRQARFLSRCSQGNEACKIFPVRQSIRQPDGIFVYPLHKLVPSSKTTRFDLLLLLNNKSLRNGL